MRFLGIMTSLAVIICLALALPEPTEAKVRPLACHTTLGGGAFNIADPDTGLTWVSSITKTPYESACKCYPRYAEIANRYSCTSGTPSMCGLCAEFRAYYTAAAFPYNEITLCGPTDTQTDAAKCGSVDNIATFFVTCPTGSGVTLPPNGTAVTYEIGIGPWGGPGCTPYSGATFTVASTFP